MFWLKKSDQFVNKVSKSSSLPNYNSFSRKTSTSLSQTTLSVSEGENENEVKMQVFGRTTTYTNPALLLIVPQSLINFEQIIHQLDQLGRDYHAQKAIRFIQENLRAHEIFNIKNLLWIDDRPFWTKTLPQLINLLVKELPLMRQDFKMLLANQAQLLDFTRLEIFLLLICMFLGIMPMQPHETCLNFGELMAQRNNQPAYSKLSLRREKLKCIMAYFKMMINDKKIWHETILIQRASNKNIEYLDISKRKKSTQLRRVEVCLIQKEEIEDFCGKAIMVLPCRRQIGSGALKNGNSKQDLMFFTFPELVILKLLCQQLNHSEAVLVYRARRFAYSSGQNDSFQFGGLYPPDNLNDVDKSVFVCIDSLNYSKNQLQLFSKNGVMRDIQKAFVGFDGACLGADQKMGICTGKWTCGKQYGGEDLKFLIQWIACSQANRDMIYTTRSQTKMKQYRLMAEELSRLSVLDLFCLILQYISLRPRLNQNCFQLFDFIKYYA